MKHSLLISLFGLLSILGIKSQNNKYCHYGFTFEVSKCPNWGEFELIITGIDPLSPAEKSGLKVGDIIMEINGKATYLRDNQTIAKWIFDEKNPEVKFTIRNMNTYFWEYAFERQCLNINSVGERELANKYSFYSLESNNQRKFTLPLNVDPNPKIDYTDYHTFDFHKDANPSELDKFITDLLEKHLISKGLTRDTNDPDIVIQSYYTFEPNKEFFGKSNVPASSWRFDSEKKAMVLLPFLDAESENAKKAGHYVAHFGFSMHDRKYVNPGKLTQIWDCYIKDYLNSKYSIEEYIRIHTPLMMMQFPYTKARTEATYQVNFEKYNYTGIYFDSEDMLTVGDVITGSPAFNAGMRAGYKIVKIDGKKFEHTPASLAQGYDQFVSETMVYRNPSTRFTSAEGNPDCMFWDGSHYSNIAKAFKKDKYVTNLSYLFNFESYIKPKTSDGISIEAHDGMQLRVFNIKPEIRKSVIIKSL